MDDIDEKKRVLLFATMLAMVPRGISDAVASPLNPKQTIIQPANTLPWKPTTAYPRGAQDTCALAGDADAPGLYYVLVRWWPGFMSAPHMYTSDRLSVVVSGTWYCNSGPDFDPASCVPVPAGSFVRRVAGTPHYDGVAANGTEPAVVAICGIGPVNHTLVDPNQPGCRKV